MENRCGLIGSAPNMESFIFLLWDIRTYNFRDILYINEVTFKLLKIMTKLSPVIYRHVPFYMFSLNNNDNQYKLQNRDAL